VHADKHKHVRELNKYSTGQTESNLAKHFAKIFWYKHFNEIQ